MRKYSYSLFPKPLVLTGYSLILLSFGYILISLTVTDFRVFLRLPAPITLIFIGFVLSTLRASVILHNDRPFIIKETSLLKMTFSTEKVLPPHDCKKLLIRERNKKGTGYFKFVIPVSYSLKSYDMFLCSGSKAVRLINTDYERALEIARFLKPHFSFEQVLKISGSGSEITIVLP
jgi:hypothetical protein